VFVRTADPERCPNTASISGVDMSKEILIPAARNDGPSRNTGAKAAGAAYRAGFEILGGEYIVKAGIEFVSLLAVYLGDPAHEWAARQSLADTLAVSII